MCRSALSGNIPGSCISMCCSHPNNSRLAVVTSNSMTNFGRASATRKRIRVSLVLLLALALVGVVLVFWASNRSLAVNFVNDTSQTVNIPDCGPDLTQIDAGQTVTLSVYENTRTCTVDGNLQGNEAIVGCVHLPSPLTNGLTIRISVAERTPHSRTCP